MMMRTVLLILVLNCALFQISAIAQNHGKLIANWKLDTEKYLKLPDFKKEFDSKEKIDTFFKTRMSASKTKMIWEIFDGDEVIKSVSTYKVVKDEDKTLVLSVETVAEDDEHFQVSKGTFSITFVDDNSITIGEGKRDKMYFKKTKTKGFLKHKDPKLLEAVKKGDLIKVKESLKSGADINAAYEHTETALIAAALRLNFDMVKLLIDEGANVNQKIMGKTALNSSLNEWSREIYQQMGSLKVTKDKRNKHIALVKLLIDKGADINAADNQGDTPLDYAITWKASPEIKALLIKHGAKTKAQVKEINGKNSHRIRLLEIHSLKTFCI